MASVIQLIEKKKAQEGNHINYIMIVTPMTAIVYTRQNRDRNGCFCTQDRIGIEMAASVHKNRDRNGCFCTQDRIGIEMAASVHKTE